MIDLALVDVIIPAWTETLDHLGDALDSVREYMKPIVVFNGPDAALVSQRWWDDDLGLSVAHLSTEYLEAERPGCFQCNARNYGLELTSNEWVAFLDADDAFLPGIDEVVRTAQQGRHRGAYGAMITTWADGSDEQRRLAGPPSMTVPHHGTYVLRRDACPLFDVWAPHQVPYRGVPYGYRFWGQVADEDIVEVDADALMYRHKWSERQASERYWANEGFITAGERSWPTA